MSQIVKGWAISAECSAVRTAMKIEPDKDGTIAVFFDKESAIRYMNWMADNAFPYYIYDRDSINVSRRVNHYDNGSITLGWDHMKDDTRCTINLTPKEIIIT